MLYIPAIVLAEIDFLNEKLGRPIDFGACMAALRSASQFVLVPFNPEDTFEFDRDNAVPEMHDRIIVGVARRFNATYISMDKDGEVLIDPRPGNQSHESLRQLSSG